MINTIIILFLSAIILTEYDDVPRDMLLNVSSESVPTVEECSRDSSPSENFQDNPEDSQQNGDFIRYVVG
jgi:hypothetical protein